MDDIVIDYLMYAISLVLVVGLLSYSMLNYKSGTRHVENSSHHLELAREDYSIGAYTKDGYYISGKAVKSEIMSNSSNAILLKDVESYCWVQRPESMSDYSTMTLRSTLNTGITEQINIDGEYTLNDDEAYRMTVYRVTTGSGDVMVYVLE